MTKTPASVFHLQALPSDGYTRIFENMITGNDLIDVRLNVDYFDVSFVTMCYTSCSLDICLYWAVKMLTVFATWAEIINSPKNNQISFHGGDFMYYSFYKLPG